MKFYLLSLMILLIACQSTNKNSLFEQELVEDEIVLNIPLDWELRIKNSNLINAFNPLDSNEMISVEKIAAIKSEESNLTYLSGHYINLRDIDPDVPSFYIKYKVDTKGHEFFTNGFESNMFGNQLLLYFLVYIQGENIYEYAISINKSRKDAIAFLERLTKNLKIDGIQVVPDNNKYENVSKIRIEME